MIKKNDAAMTPPQVVFDLGAEYGDGTRIWQGIPSIEKMKDGRLWVTFYGGGKREGKGNYIVLVKSDDDGATWSEPYMVLKHANPDVRTFDSTIWNDPQGRLLMFFSQTYGLYDGRVGVWAMVCENPDAKIPVWGKPARIANGVMLNKPTSLSSGEWILPCALWICDEAEEDHGLQCEMHSNVYVSKDNGASFSLRGYADVPDRHYDEHTVVELKDGRLWMLVRTHYGIGQSFSDDKGATWTKGEKTSLSGPSSRFFITRLKSGRLLLVNHHNFIKRNNLTAMLSDDDGKTWKGNLLIDGRDNVSYPNGVQDSDGNIYVVYDRERGKEREILMCVFSEEDIMAGKFAGEKSKQRVIVNKGKKD